jgi:hypothetical protein
VAEQQDYLRGDFERVSPLRPRRSQKRDDEPVVKTKAAEPASTAESVPAAAPPREAPAEPPDGEKPAAAAPQPTPAAPAKEAAAEPAQEAGAAPAPAEAAPAPVEAPVETKAPTGAGLEAALGADLATFLKESAEIQAAAVVSLDGFIMAAALPADLEEDRVAAMSAAILALGERAASELRRGRLSQVFIEGEKGYVLLMSCGSRAALVAMAAKDAKLGLVFYDMKRAAGAIAQALAAG